MRKTPEELKAVRDAYQSAYREKNRAKRNRERQEYFNLNPWLRSLRNAKSRCNNPNVACYHRYGGRGIQCLLTKEDVKTLWFRDKAASMICPSIDRVDNDGHYELSNCRFIENGDNKCGNAGKATHCPHGHAYIGDNIYFDSIGSRRCRACRVAADAKRRS